MTTNELPPGAGSADVHTEIERVFLLDAPPELPAEAEAFRIEQGYFEESGDPSAAGGAGGRRGRRRRALVAEGRVRRRIGPDGDVVCTRTVKRGLGIQRSEDERTISEVEFEAAWGATAGRRIRKTRYRVPETSGGGSGGLVWEIDVFEDFDLVLAEVELPAVDTPLDLPAWLAPRVVREVTEEPAYRNHALALNGGIVTSRSP